MNKPLKDPTSVAMNRRYSPGRDHHPVEIGELGDPADVARIGPDDPDRVSLDQVLEVLAPVWIGVVVERVSSRYMSALRGVCHGPPQPKEQVGALGEGVKRPRTLSGRMPHELDNYGTRNAPAPEIGPHNEIAQPRG